MITVKLEKNQVKALRRLAQYRLQYLFTVDVPEGGVQELEMKSLAQLIQLLSKSESIMRDR